MKPNDSFLKEDTSMPEKFILTLKRDLADLEKLRSFLDEIRQRLSVSKRCLFETNLALEEVFSNVLSYGFNNYMPKSKTSMTRV